MTAAAESARAEDAAFSRDLETALEQFFADRAREVEAISAAAVEVVTAIRELTAGGKKLRARWCHRGWRAAGGPAAAEPVVLAAAALELFQTAALIHDDVLDRSDTRRGRPSVHRRFEAAHRQAQWSHDPEHFGVGAAVLAGDLALSFAEELFTAACRHVQPAAADAARAIFTTMRTEVMVGQYLDVHAEVAPASSDPAVALERAMTVLRYKSAKYSVQHPVRLGAALAGAPAAHVERVGEFGLPVGEAFQLRDDVLGVFGDPASTGKPAGDDLREGKRTALVALFAARAEPKQLAWLESVLGRADLDAASVQRARDLITASGALEECEALIDRLVHTADARLAELECAESARAGLRALAEATVRRDR